MSQPTRDSMSGLTDLISFVSDVAHSIDALLEVYLPACHSLHLSGKQALSAVCQDSI
jgi:hypothetical protein